MDARLLREPLAEVDAGQFDLTHVSKHSAGLERLLRRLSENLLVQFSVASFVVMALIAVGLATVLSNKIRSDAIGDLVDETVGASSSRLLAAINPADLETPMTGERYDKFH